jgi:hypothetical protein
LRVELLNAQSTSQAAGQATWPADLLTWNNLVGKRDSANSANFATPGRIVKLSADNDLMGQIATSPRVTSISKNMGLQGNLLAPNRSAVL